MNREQVIKKIEKSVGTYSNSLTQSIAESVYNDVVAPYINIIKIIRGECEETEGGNELIVESIKNLIDSFEIDIQSTH